MQNSANSDVQIHCVKIAARDLENLAVFFHNKKKPTSTMQSRNWKRTAAEAELEEEELENEEQPNKAAYRWRNAPQSMYNVFNAIQTGEVEHPTYQPEWLLPEIQMMVSEYSGGTCDNITQSAHHCWTQHRLLDETEQLVHNCTEYCFAHTDDWLLPILLSFPTYGVINSQRFELNLTRAYYIEMKNLYHISVGAINISVFQNYDMSTIECVIGTDPRFDRRKASRFAQFIPFLQERLQEVEPSAQIRTYANAVKFSDSVVTHEDVLTIMRNLYSTVIAPILLDSTGCTMLYRVEIDCESMWNRQTCQLLQSKLESIPVQIYCDSSWNWKTCQSIPTSPISLPDFADDQAVWEIQFSKKGGQHPTMTLQTSSLFYV